MGLQHPLSLRLGSLKSQGIPRIWEMIMIIIIIQESQTT